MSAHFSTNAQPSVTADTPYPPIRVIGKNPRWACLIGQVLRSKDGEMTAITSYLYQHWTLPPCYQSIRDITYRIAQVEMHHMDILGSLTVQLGGLPKFAVDACSSWNGMAVDYSTNIRHVLLENLSGEQAAVNTYGSLAKEITDPYVQQILKRIAMDEQVHVCIFKQLLDTL